MHHYRTDCHIQFHNDTPSAAANNNVQLKSNVPLLKDQSQPRWVNIAEHLLWSLLCEQIKNIFWLELFRLTLQFPSSSTDNTMVPHFFPGMPLWKQIDIIHSDCNKANTLDKNLI